MSMRNYGVHDYGLYITFDDVSEYAEENGIAEYEVMDEFTTYSESDGTATPIPYDADNEFEVDYNGFAIAQLENYPSLFNRAYTNYEEALAELKNKYGKYLNKDFDYKNRFVEYVGSMFG